MRVQICRSAVMIVFPVMILSLPANTNKITWFHCLQQFVSLIGSSDHSTYWLGAISPWSTPGITISSVYPWVHPWDHYFLGLPLSTPRITISVVHCVVHPMIWLQPRPHSAFPTKAPCCCCKNSEVLSKTVLSGVFHNLCFRITSSNCVMLWCPCTKFPLDLLDASHVFPTIEYSSKMGQRAPIRASRWHIP